MVFYLIRENVNNLYQKPFVKFDFMCKKLNIVEKYRKQTFSPKKVGNILYIPEVQVYLS